MTTRSQRFYQAHQHMLPYEKALGAAAVTPIEFLESGTPGDGVVTDAVAAGTLVEIVPMHVKNPPRITFMAFIKTQKESFKPSYDSVKVFGRPDPYYIWKGNDRSITFSLDVPSSGKDMALRNLVNLQWFLASLYPAYKGTENNSVSASPLFRVKYSNMVMSAANHSGLLCVIQNVSVTPDIKTGYISLNLDEIAGMSDGAAQLRNGPDLPRFKQVLAGPRDVSRPNRLLIPKNYSLGFTLNVVHEHSLGWQHETGEWRAGDSVGFPYGIGLDKQKETPPPPPPVIYEAVEDPAPAQGAPTTEEGGTIDDLNSDGIPDSSLTTADIPGSAQNTVKKAMNPYEFVS